MTREDEFVACLLANGPLYIIPTSEDHSVPLSTTDERTDIRNWCVSTLSMSWSDFDEWWVEYKRWFVNQQQRLHSCVTKGEVNGVKTNARRPDR